MKQSIEDMCRELIREAEASLLVNCTKRPANMSAGDLTGMSNLLSDYLLAEVRRLREVLGEINTVAVAMEQLAVAAGVRFDAAKWREIKEKTSAAELDAKPKEKSS